MNHTMADSQYFSPTVLRLKPNRESIDCLSAIAHFRTQALVCHACATTILYG
jgi:hypothetical protein